MHTGKWELGVGPVIEMSVVPACRRVANAAVVRKSRLGVVGVVGCVEFLGVAAVAIGRRPFITAANMAGRAIKRGMHPRQGETRKLRMVELRAQPCIHGGVAVLTGGWKTRRLVIGHRILVLNLVAGVTVHRQPLELPDRRVLVAGFALQRGMGANQWEAVLMLFDGRR